MICTICNKPSKLCIPKNKFKTCSSDARLVLKNENIFFCKRCNFFFKKVNSLIKKNLNKIYKNYKTEKINSNQKKFFIYKKNMITRSQSIVDFLLKKNFLRKGMKVLDFGCGNGDLALKLKSQGLETYAYDLKVAKNLNFNSGVKFFDNFEDLKLIKFDIIFLVHVLEHIYEPKKLKQQLNQISKNNTLIFIQTPNISNSIFDFFWYDHINHFNEYSIKKYLQKFFQYKNHYFIKITNNETSLLTGKFFNKNSIIKKNNFRIDKIEKVPERLEKILKKIKDFRSYNILGAGIKLKLINENVGIKNLRYILDEDKNKKNKFFLKKKIVLKLRNTNVPLIVLDNLVNFIRIKNKFNNQKIKHINISW